MRLFDEWSAKARRLLLQAKQPVAKDTVLSKLKELKATEYEPTKLATLQADYLRNLFGTKLTAPQIVQLAEQSTKQHIESSVLRKIFGQNTAARDLATTLEICTKEPKPLKAFRDHLATLGSSFLIRPVDLQKQLSLFREAVELRMTVKDFLSDQIPLNRHWFSLAAREGWTTKDVEHELARPIAKRTKLRGRWR